MTSQQNLRQQGRDARRSLSLQERREASHQICEKLKNHCVSATKVALYLAMEEEVDLSNFIAWAALHFKKIYVPVVQKNADGSKTLQFFRKHPDADFRPGAFGIQEPVLPQDVDRIELSDCDVVLIPLVAFDEQLKRIGMGSGLYDRALAEGLLKKSKRPWFLGCAFECQKVPHIEANPWDVSLDAVMTERYFYQSAEASMAKA